jgi:hypothetical protein
MRQSDDDIVFDVVKNRYDYADPKTPPRAISQIDALRHQGLYSVECGAVVAPAWACVAVRATTIEKDQRWRVLRIGKKTPELQAAILSTVDLGGLIAVAQLLQDM